MKFGRCFQQCQIPGWEASYVDYVACKRMYKDICIDEHSKSRCQSLISETYLNSLIHCSTSNPTLALNGKLDAEHKRVESIYADRLSIVQQSVAALHAWYGIHEANGINTMLHQINRGELRALVRQGLALLEKLQEVFQYGYLNQQAFLRILSKLEHPSAHSSEVFTAFNPVETQFSHQVPCLESIDTLMQFIVTIWPVCLTEPPHEATLPLRLKIHESSQALESSVEEFSRAVLHNNASHLQELLQGHGDELQGQGGKLQPLLADLLEYSVLCLASKCTDALIPYIRSLVLIDPNGTGNILHRLTASIGLGSKPRFNRLTHHDINLPALENTDQAIRILLGILDALSVFVRPALSQKDILGRSPVHYAAMYGLTELCSTHLERAAEEQGVLFALVSELLVTQDSDGFAPLQLSIRGGHFETTHILADSFKMVAAVGDVVPPGCLSDTLIGALNVGIARLSHKRDHEAAHYLVSALQDVASDKPNLQKAVLLAVQYGCQSLLEELFTRFPDTERLLNIPDASQCWTPLIIASVEGHFEIVKILVQSGADVALRDRKGWTAKDHAAFRGHLEIAEWFADRELPVREQMERSQNSVDTPEDTQRKATLSSLPSYPRPLPIANDETQILLSIGPANTRSKLQGVDLSPMLPHHDGRSCDYVGYAIQIHSEAARGPSALIRLPILEEVINDPWCYSTKDKDIVTFTLNLIGLKNQNDINGRIIASGVAELKYLQRGFSVDHESLSRDYTIPLLHEESLKLAGRVTVCFLVVTPLYYLGTPPGSKSGFWKMGTQVVGHRGAIALSRLWKKSYLYL